MLGRVGMVGAITLRTSVYLDTLAREALLPSVVFLLAHASEEEAGRVADIQKCIEANIASNKLEVIWLPSHDINTPEVGEILERSRPEIFLYSGRGGA